MKRIVLAFIGCIVFSLVLQSCSKEIVDPGSTPTGITVPKKGSWFTVHYMQKDSNNKVLTEGYETFTVLQTGLTKFGRNSVLMVEEAMEDDLDTFYVYYDQNGDFSMHSESADQWTVFPFGSKQTLTNDKTKTHELNGKMVTYHTRDTTKYIGGGQQTVLDKTFSISTLRISGVTEEFEENNPQPLYADYSYADYSYIPSLGFWGRIYYPHQIDGETGLTGNELDMTLSSYELK